MRALLSALCTGARGEFNDASALEGSLYWCQALHIRNKDKYQNNKHLQTLALFNSPQVLQVDIGNKGRYRNNNLTWTIVELASG